MSDLNVPTAHPVEDSVQQEPVKSADGAVRQLEKSAIAERATPSREEPSDKVEVRSFGKAGEGAPEEEAADASELNQRR